MSDFKPTQQIAYVPRHANGDVAHRDVEHGFVTSTKRSALGLTVYCRYWSKYHPDTLRTQANSEGADADMIVPLVTHTQQAVEDAWKAHVPCSACGTQRWNQDWSMVRSWLTCQQCGHEVECIMIPEAS